jgi:hypothetical protein
MKDHSIEQSYPVSNKKNISEAIKLNYELEVKVSVGESEKT